MANIKDLLIGKPLKSADGNDESHLLTKTQALAMLSSDALSSVAYGPETIVQALMVASAAAIWFSLPIAIIILILLAALIMSYRQVIHAYPSGGGAYLVATGNLGFIPGLIAGGSLLVDYMLTVAVSTASGADAITSAVPVLYKYNLWIAIGLAVILMLMNLRGLRESASFLMIPVYAFIVSTFILLIVGVIRVATGSLPFDATAHIGTTVSNLTIIILLKAFSTGSSSLTGVEAISNAVPFFKKPKENNAAATLAIMGTILGIFFVGIIFLNYWMGVTPKASVTVVAQIATKVFGGGIGYIFFLIFQFATALILAVAANTGYSAFPMLAFNMAKNKVMPHMYMERGARNGYSNGIFSLAVGAILLLFIFNGQTDNLIPLYAIGVFTPFALAQTGMVRYWYKKLGAKFLTKAIFNVIGALISAGIVLILVFLRISQVWPYFIIMPILIFMFVRIKTHYGRVAEQLRVSSEDIHAEHYTGNTVIVLVGNITKPTVDAISYAESIGDTVVALHVGTKDSAEKDKEIHDEFKTYFPDIKFETVESNYRDIVRPVIRYIALVSGKAQKNNHTMTVVVPQFMPNKRWQVALHNQMALRLRLFLGRYDNIIVANYTYHLKK
ncbi:MAG: APC family permease [Streptococcaceae bacterium]|jgi:amino acid transporter|nr:APC family permease [Streptococcaceae bacterium]